MKLIFGGLLILSFRALALGPVENIAFEKVTVVEGKSSFIMSLSILKQREIEVGGDIDTSDLDEESTGLGFAFEYNLNSNYGLEVGLYNIKRRYVITSGGETLAEEVSRAHFPLLIRGWLWNNLSFGLGPFGSFRTAKVRRASSAQGSQLETQATDDIEFGLETAATLNFAYGDKTGIFLEGRWSEPFNQRENVEINQLTALAGIKVEVEL